MNVHGIHNCCQAGWLSQGKEWRGSLASSQAEEQGDSQEERELAKGIEVS